MHHKYFCDNMKSRNFEQMFEKRDREVHRMDYKKGIMEQIEQIKSKQVLKFLYELIIAFKENWGC